MRALPTYTASELASPVTILALAVSAKGAVSSVRPHINAKGRGTDLGNVIDAEEGVGHEQRLDGSKLGSSTHMARAIECASAVLPQHCIECCQCQHLLRRLCILFSQHIPRRPKLQSQLVLEQISQSNAVELRAHTENPELLCQRRDTAHEHTTLICAAMP